MSFDEYVNHISQKYRLAVAISVIKTKPEGLSIEDYLTQLQRKINMESDQNETVCSDDFNFDEDMIENHQSISEKANNDNEIHLKSNAVFIQPENANQTSQTILGDFVFGDVSRSADVDKRSFVIGDTLKLLKATDGTDIAAQPFINQQASSQLTFCESQAASVVNNSNCYSMPSNAGLIMRIPENNIDSQETELYTLHGFTQDYTHVSQTQEEHFFISDKFIRNNLYVQENADSNNTQCSQIDNNKIVTANIEYTNNPKKEIPIIDRKVVNKEEISKPIEGMQITEHIQLSNDILETQEDAIENAKDVNENIEECDEMDVDDKTDSDNSIHIVKVPFKVLEELNKVKSYLNKKGRRNTEGYSTDSGYRSDSQVRHSFKTSSQCSQLSGAWLNQSAYCLYSYITQVIQAPTASDDITKEISKILGQLIDKLHEEENYPSFLETLLETVDNLIQDIHKGDSWDENVLITKDENMHRLNLLNKSKHILKYSIENITNILEKLHTNLTQENLYELTNISELENTSYIFHILEIFLKRYMKLKDVASQSTQSSQDGNIAKRSSLTDLWRKKWNPNYKETCKLEEKVTICVVKRCSEVLNKMIVDCIDGYSLVAFSALQCFNLIQS